MSRPETFVVIPTKYAIDHLINLLETIEVDDEIDRFLIIDNGHSSESLDRIINWVPKVGNATVLTLPDLTITQMWNCGLDFANIARKTSNYNVMFLNDDIKIQPFSISYLSSMMQIYPKIGIISLDPNHTNRNIRIERVNTTAGAGGLAGFAFMLRGGLGLRFDENLKLYWGDDDIVKQVIASGYEAAVMRGVPVEHAGSLTIRQMDQAERERLMEQDRIYFNRKYGEHRERVNL